MNSNQKIDMFMEAKAKKIYRLTGHSKTLYYDRVDKKNIRNLSKKDADYVWENITNALTPYGLDVDTCPFCLLSIKDHTILYCKECKYGKNHGICGADTSSYEEIFLLLFSRIKLSSSEIFPNDYYFTLIARINSK